MSSQPNARRFSPIVERGELRVRTTTDPVESYADRDGYRSDFLGEDVAAVPLPRLGRWAEEGAVVYRTDVPTDYIVPYRHFSVVVAKKRRVPLISAVNIDGSRERTGIPRTNVWKRDPRIDLSAQILEECYGRSDEGYFSRGHMTRREDPNWGTLEEATQADADTFHATNAAPQAQSFNSPIWLGLEDYLLRHARADDMKISVFSGPVLHDDDIEMYGIKIPSRFWKVVVFVNEESGRLTATGYIASQAVQVEALRAPLFVFGKYSNWQVPLRAIGVATGLDFAGLSRFDPLVKAGERFALQLDSHHEIYLA